MSSNDKLMETSKGGESTQYEKYGGAGAFHSTPNKQEGQLSNTPSSTNDAPRTTTSEQPNSLNVSTAGKIRYGQALQHGGAGGKTEGFDGVTRSAGGFGGTQATSDEEGKGRVEQGYGSGNDMDREVGA